MTGCTKGGRVIVCTVASDVPGELWAQYQRTFHELGCKDVVHLDIERRADLLLNPSLELFEGADVFFFTGGAQLKITTRLAGTRLCAALEEFYRRGGTVVGTSAGASVMAETMLVSGVSGETHKIGETLQMAPGLGFLRDTIIDQHFAERSTAPSIPPAPRPRTDASLWHHPHDPHHPRLLTVCVNGPH
ncbi:Cyanophycinase [Cystobacter fuscus DSM 2262]|uniref:Cyanophycinase n=1 Tax=Cystobacter fuscus (strain ATCC 25194 / DSM 2262 / NBRC 100088 / M29) TaxID=1242864 RepID=S9QP55_CYSF2|nr:Cyanophycinase [Cystobacter fuscus DSM 2262]